MILVKILIERQVYDLVRQSKVIQVNHDLWVPRSEDFEHYDEDSLLYICILDVKSLENGKQLQPKPQNWMALNYFTFRAFMRPLKSIFCYFSMDVGQRTSWFCIEKWVRRFAPFQNFPMKVPKKSMIWIELHMIKVAKKDWLSCLAKENPLFRTRKTIKFTFT